MSHQGKVQITFVIVAPPDQVAAGDRIFESHAKWMAESHYREGDKALLQYNVAKGPDPDGNMCFILTEVYETEAGIDDHYQQANDSWSDIDAFRAWLGACSVTQVRQASVIQSLW